MLLLKSRLVSSSIHRFASDSCNTGSSNNRKSTISISNAAFPSGPVGHSLEGHPERRYSAAALHLLILSYTEQLCDVGGDASALSVALLVQMLVLSNMLANSNSLECVNASCRDEERGAICMQARPTCLR